MCAHSTNVNRLEADGVKVGVPSLLILSAWTLSSGTTTVGRIKSGGFLIEPMHIQVFEGVCVYVCICVHACV